MEKKGKGILIVGINTNKQDAYMACRREEVIRVAHGVYFPANQPQQNNVLFQEFGIRLAKYFFPHSALTHATAWFKKPENNVVFVGGDYPYRKSISLDSSELRIMQSMVHPQLDNSLLYIEQQFHDRLGSFTMHCATPELVVIQQMEATKQNMDKHLSPQEEARLHSFLLTKHGNRITLLSILEQVAEAAGKRNEFERLLRQFFLRRFKTDAS